MSNLAFPDGWVTFSANFRWKRISPTNHCWCQKTRVIAISCGIKISPVGSFVSCDEQGHLTVVTVYTAAQKYYDRFSGIPIYCFIDPKQENE